MANLTANQTSENTTILSAFSSHSFKPREAIALWNEALTGLFSTIPVNEDEFVVEAELHQLGALVMAKSKATRQHYSTGGLRARLRGDGPIIATLLIQGSTQGENAGRAFNLVAGNLCLVDLGREAHSTTNDYIAIDLIIPRDLLLAHIPKNARIEAVHIEQATPLGFILINQIKSTAQVLSRLTPETAETAGRMLIETVARCIESECRALVESDRGSDQVAFDGIDAYISRHLTSDTLTPEHLCQVFRCSRSYLYRLFQPHGGVARYVRYKRLERAYQVLRTTEGRAIKIQDLALELGFKNQAHFAKAFRQTFSQSPTEVLSGTTVPRFNESGSPL